MDNLPELRDIHLPTHDVSMWPLANGWWVLLVAIILLYALGKALFWLRRQSAKIYARHILNGLDMQNYITAAAKMSEILRRACVRRYPEAVALSGDEWLAFINAKSVQKLDEKTAKLLRDAPYIPVQSTLYTQQDALNLRRFCVAWVGENL